MPHEHDEVAAAAAEIGPHLTTARFAVCKTWAALKRTPHSVGRRRLSRDLPDPPKVEAPAERVDVESVQTALLLADFEEVSLDDLQPWNATDRRAAYEWAIREHLHAGDNDEVPRLPMPECVRRLKEAQHRAR